jgi:hypothetical protein
MDSNQVVKILVFFRDIEKEIRFCDSVIEDLNDEYYSLRGVDFDGIGNPNEVGDPTSRIALNTPDSVRQTQKQMTERIAKLCEIKQEVYAELDKLPYIQKAVVHGFYIERLPWTKISYREHYSVRGLKKIRTKTIKSLGLSFAENRLISSFFL